MNDYTNADRADSARAAAEAFAIATGSQDEDLRTQLVDLLANIMHLADEEGLVFDALTESAYLHYEDEIDEEHYP